MNKTVSRIFLVISLFSFGFIAALVFLSDFDLAEQSRAQSAEFAPVSSVPRAEAALQPGTDGSLQSFNNAFVQIAENVTPSVVTINSEQVVDLPDRFQQFFGFQEEGDMTRPVLGSGVVVREDGYILTNNHVVARGQNITVTMADGTQYDAEEVVTDEITDLAVIRIDASGLPAIEIGDSDELRVGEWVVAIGSPFGEQLRHTVTAGIVSATGRTEVMTERNLIQDFIQTDAAINPGNSGGALVNLYGQLVGINTAIATQSGGYQGIGFAIPANMAVNVMNDLIERGEVTRSYLGVSIQPVDDDATARALGLDRPTGAIVNEIFPDSPAENSNLRNGDVIIRVDNYEIDGPGALQARIAQLEPGTDHELTVVRNGNERTIQQSPQGDNEGSGGTGSLGLALEDITPSLVRQYDLSTSVGVLVISVQAGSPAAERGIARGDIITHVGVDNPVDSVDDFQNAMDEYDAGDSVLFRVQRGENSFFVGITIPEE